ncbi:S-Ena type endospore appendage [Oceanobacillus arenosus]|uniref:S-Ena type endospore appendage n=1 Tax=Oceanobacillus arenosus TaxID=1229153 RepID=UPI003CCC6C56
MSSYSTEMRCSVRTVFKSATSCSMLEPPSTTISITNTSDQCKMLVCIEREKDDFFKVIIEPGSSFTTVFANLDRIDVSCKGDSNYDCTCQLDMNLFFIVNIEE